MPNRHRDTALSHLAIQREVAHGQSVKIRRVARLNLTLAGTQKGTAGLCTELQAL